MDFLGGNILPPNPHAFIYLAGIAIVLLVGVCLSTLLTKSTKSNENMGVLRSVFLFIWSCFLKPHDGDAKRNQQDALESFYKGQAGAYDATRKTLLRGREDMLALAAAQVLYKVQRVDQTPGSKRRVWIDVSYDMTLWVEVLLRLTDDIDWRRDWLEH